MTRTTARRRGRLVAAALALAVAVPAAAAAMTGPPATAAEPSAAPAETGTAEQEEYAGYLFSYFTGEGTADGEQVYFGLSEGNDPLHYRALNDGEPVLTSDLGDHGVRDPFIIRDPRDGTFYQIATDLKVHGDGDWDKFQRHGSRSIVVWESDDLVSWSEPRLVEVAPDNAGNTWAPEAYWDDERGEFVVFWASKLYDADDPEHTGDQHNRMMYATTKDFRTFSEAQVWIDPGYSVIDSTVTKHDGQYYRFTKDERNNTSSTPCSKFITAEKSTDLRSTDYDFIADCIGKATEGSPGIAQGEGPTIFKSNTEEKWYQFIDEFGGRGYVPFETTDLDSGEWTMSDDYEMPGRPRHGTVLPVTQAEYDRLLRHYQPDAFVEEVEPVEVTTQARRAPALPDEVSVTYADGSTGTEKVSWDDVDASAYARPHTSFEVTGTLADGVSATATATVTVQPQRVPVTSLTVEPAEVELWQGTEQRLTASVEPANASDARVRWESTDPSVATVSDRGVVQAVAPGTTTVVAATNGAHRAEVAVTVTAEPPAWWPGTRWTRRPGRRRPTPSTTARSPRRA